MIWITLALILSVALNVLLLWYIRQTLKRLLFASENFAWLVDSLRSFGEHLQGIHELEMYYGDTTLQALIKHSKDLVNDMENFEQIYTLLDGESEMEDGEEEKE